MKKDSISQAVKDKIDDVFGVCERVVDYCIPDEQCERPEYGKDYDVFSRMSDFSYDVSARICRRFLPYVSEPIEDCQEEHCEEQDKKKRAQPSLRSLKEPLLKMKDQCIESVKPVVSPFSPITTPLLSLIVLLFSTIRLAFCTIFVDPVLYIIQKLRSFITAGKHELTPDENGKVPVVSLAEDLYAKASNEMVELFTDADGHVSLSKFQQLCKDKSVEYQQLLHDHVTAEKLQAFLSDRGNEVKEAMGTKLEPVKKAGKEGMMYYQQLVDLFADEEGKFSVQKIQDMAGKSGNELKNVLGKAKGAWEAGKKDVVEKAKELNGAVHKRVEKMKRQAMSSMSVLVGIVALFPTIGMLLTVFVLSYFVDVKKILPEQEDEKVIVRAVEENDDDI